MSTPCKSLSSRFMPKLSQDKIFRYLTAALGLFVVILVVREIFFSSGDLTMPDISFPIPDINVRTEVFDKFNVGDLTPFQNITMPEIIGRDTPFSPYSIEEYNAALAALYSTSTATTTTPIATTTEEVATTTEE